MSRYARMVIRLHKDGMGVYKAVELVSITYKVGAHYIMEELHENGYQF